MMCSLIMRGRFVVVPTNVQDEVDVDDHPQNMEDQTQDTQNIPDPDKLIQQEQNEFMAEQPEEQADIANPEEHGDPEEKANPVEEVDLEEDVEKEEHVDHEEKDAS